MSLVDFYPDQNLWFLIWILRKCGCDQYLRQKIILEKSLKEVVIYVDGGVASVEECPDDILVIIDDHDAEFYDSDYEDKYNHLAKKVVISVDGGVASVEECPNDVVVTILDNDI